jgi:ankyrin repeat protein
MPRETETVSSSQHLSTCSLLVSKSRGISTQRESRDAISVKSNQDKANPKLSSLKDDDERVPLHWAVSYNHAPVVELLMQAKDFDPDVKVRSTSHDSRIFSAAHRTASAGPPS